jgi:hypothetical protein
LSLELEPPSEPDDPESDFDEDSDEPESDFDPPSESDFDESPPPDAFAVAPLLA